MLGNVNTSSALSAFEKMEEKGELINVMLFVAKQASSSIMFVPNCLYHVQISRIS